jgi:KorB C-terminal beta-barrel domain
MAPAFSTLWFCHPSQGSAWLQYDDGQVARAKLANVQLVALLEGYKPSTAKEGS